MRLISLAFSILLADIPFATPAARIYAPLETSTSTFVRRALLMHACMHACMRPGVRDCTDGGERRSPRATPRAVGMYKLSPRSRAYISAFVRAAHEFTFSRENALSRGDARGGAALQQQLSARFESLRDAIIK